MSAEQTHATAARCSWICIALAAIPTMLVAETEEEANVRANAASLLAELRTEFECTIAVTGTPRFDEFGNAWLIAFTAAGPGCDEAASALVQRGKELGAKFFRRPDKDQLKAILADLRRTVRRGFGCPISIRGEPQPEEPSGYWVVNIVGSGADCADAIEELGRLGEALQIRFVRTYTQQDRGSAFP